MKHRYVLIIPILVASLSSCTVWNVTPGISKLDPCQQDSGEGYEKISTQSFSLRATNKTSKIMNLNPIGDSNILIVPVQASDGRPWDKKMLANLNTVFFGKAEETGWQSVNSYYKTSSYGKLNIGGEVAPTYSSKHSIKELSTNVVDSKNRPDDAIRKEFESTSTYNDLRVKYDTDKDGYIDSIVFVYSNAIDYTLGYWAWVYWGTSSASLEKPVVNSYMWASYNFICGEQMDQGHPYASYGDKVDGHTVIHETGHLLGINDYYCYDEKGWDPSGILEMHSNNIGDENIFSKYSMGWVNPYYVKTDKSVTLGLRTSAGYGDAILINDTWNKSACDEYLLIEYYAPKGLNNQDAMYAYPGNGYSMYTQSGFRIYHIDARVVKLNIRGGMEKYVDSLEEAGSYSLGASNSVSSSKLNEHASDYKLCHLLEGGGVNTFINGGFANNGTLFTQGKTFVASNAFFVNGKNFNDGTPVGYKLTVGQCTEEIGRITIEKI